MITNILRAIKGVAILPGIAKLGSGIIIHTLLGVSLLHGASIKANKAVKYDRKIFYAEENVSVFCNKVLTW